jgi:anti-sigma regulatory factor (Ser/Thr protein kinase)
MREVITSDLGELAKVRAFARRAARELAPSLDDDAVSGLELACNEAASNVIRHAYDARNQHRIDFEAGVDEHKLTINLCHDGKPFDQSGIAPPSFDGSRDGGFGLFIIEQCVDSVTYLADGQGRNCIRLTKNLHKGVQQNGNDG